MSILKSGFTRNPFPIGSRTGGLSGSDLFRPSRTTPEQWLRNANRVLIGLGVGSGLAFLAVVVFSLAGTVSQFGDRFAVGLVTAVAPLLVGMLLGFIFGIPRATHIQVQAAAPRKGQENAGTSPAPSPSATPAASPEGGSPINTNMEQVSDWLTKILVGVGLIKVEEIGAAFRSVARTAADGLGGGAIAMAFALGLIVYTIILGFLAGYLLTRLFLQSAFAEAARLAQGEGPTFELRELQQAALEAASGNPNTPPPGLSGDTRQLVKEISAMPLQELTEPEHIAAWARTKLLAGKVDEAILGYEKAVSLTPRDPALRQEYGLALIQAGRRDQATQQLEQARRVEDPASDPAGYRRTTEGLAFNALYEPPPQGFEKAIQLTDEYMLNHGPASAAMQVYRAAAFGQKHAWSQKNGAAPEVLAKLRERALDAARQALKIEPSWKNVLKGMLEGQGADDDLVDFAKDADFLALLK